MSTLDGAKLMATLDGAEVVGTLDDAKLVGTLDGAKLLGSRLGGKLVGTLDGTELAGPDSGALIPGSRVMTAGPPRLGASGRSILSRSVTRVRQVVMMAGRPLGMAATARATAILK